MSTITLTVGAGLLAFILAFYGLLAKERKTPYILESVYDSCALVLLSLLVALLSKTGMIDAAKLEICSLWMLIASFLYVIYRVVRLHNRHVHFRDDRFLQNTFVWRLCKNTLRSIRGTQTYEHTPLSMPDALTKALSTAQSLTHLSGTQRAELTGPFPRSLVLLASSMRQVDAFIADLSGHFSQNECWIQYMPFTRHPIEILRHLKQTFQQNAWDKLMRHFVVVDAFTKHFGFTDSICDEKTKEVRTLGVTTLLSASSYAGAHTACAAAFNHVKKRAEDLGRKTTLVIYECPRALVDLESIEQYRLFVRHVISTERIWGGMLTVFIELEATSEDESLLTAHADAVLDLRQSQRTTAPSSDAARP